MRVPVLISVVFSMLITSQSVYAEKLEPGQTKGSTAEHTEESFSKGLANADVALPSILTGDTVYFGKYSDLPGDLTEKTPLVIFLHGSSGINPKLGFDQWQTWLAEPGFASIIFDGMQLEDRLKYKSPVDKAIYEQIHSLRASEIDYVLGQMQQLEWVDRENIILAGTSEGAISVARNDNDAFAGRIIYSWSCEDNYFVDSHNTAVKSGQPILNIISAKDKYFSLKNEFIGNDAATGNCAGALAENESAEVLLIPDAPHTLINLPAARSATLGWLNKVIN